MKPGPSRTLTDSRAFAGDDGLRLVAFAPEPPLFDAELGQIFIKMRTLLGISLWDMARAVAAEPTVIANLEAGALDAFPPWPELARLVDGYAHLTGVDPQPIMSRLLRSQAPTQPHQSQQMAARMRASSPIPTAEPDHARTIDAAVSWSQQPSWQPEPEYLAPARPNAPPTDRSVRRPVAAPSSIVDVPALAEPAKIVEAPESRSSVSRRTGWIGRGLRPVKRRRLFGVLALTAIPVVFSCVARFYPGLLYAIVTPLPSVVGAPLLHGLDSIVTAMAPVREGLTWIDVGDPRLRRADKLPTVKTRPRDR